MSGRVDAYLTRLGYDATAASALKARPPNVDDLNELIKKHVHKIPFNNLAMHEHPADGTYLMVKQNNPVLDVDACVSKMLSGLGGFCFEINFSFCWLLRSLGYTVRMAEGSVMTPGGPVPGHCVLLVDGVDPSGTLLVDPGIGDFSRVAVPLALKTSGGEAVDELGDKYSLKSEDTPTPWCSRFNTVLMKARVSGMMGNPTSEPLGVPDMPVEATPPMPKYVFSDSDDLAFDSPEFQAGLGAVLTVMPENFFSQKKFSVVATDKGFKYIGASYIKEKEAGVQTRKEEFTAEAAFRKYLADDFGIELK